MYRNGLIAVPAAQNFTGAQKYCAAQDFRMLQRRWAVIRFANVPKRCRSSSNALSNLAYSRPLPTGTKLEVG
jgi:hypothetical protein